MTSSTRLPPLVRTVDIRKQTMIILTACAALTLYIGFLIASNYRSQQALQASAPPRISPGPGKAGRVSGLFLFGTRIRPSFHGRLQGDKRLFWKQGPRNVRRVRLETQFVRCRAAFSKNASGKGDPGRSHLREVRVAGQKRQDPGGQPVRRDEERSRGERGPGWSEAEIRDPGRALVSDETPEDRKSCFSISSPIDYKGIEVGELEARINPWTPWVHFVENQSFLSDKGFDLMSYDHRAVEAAVSKRPSPLRLLPDELLAKVSNERFARLPAEDADRSLLFTPRANRKNAAVPSCLGERGRILEKPHPVAPPLRDAVLLRSSFWPE